MSKENELIRLIAGSMPRSSLQLNNVFESDSEILEFKGYKLVFNIDEFSGEDMLRENDPFVLGWNLAVGAISDILATGGKPAFYAHSLVVDSLWSNEFIKSFSDGVASCLRESDTSFIGGDFGKSSDWRYTATVIGELEGSPLLRSNAKLGDSIYMTGKIGLGNFEAGLKLYQDKKIPGKLASLVKNKFNLRTREAGLVKNYSHCCIDTSDGAFNALGCISEMSNTGFEVVNLPYIKQGLILSKLLSLPKPLLFLGECGEYELLFTITKEAESSFLKEAKEKGLVFYKLGRITDPGKMLLAENGKTIDLSSFDVRARDFRDMKEYLNRIIDFIKHSSNE